MQFSVRMLEEYWKKIESLAEGGTMPTLSIYEMASWNDILFGLNWRLQPTR
jgi:hypothetical protein